MFRWIIIFALGALSATADQGHWSFLPMAQPAPPAVKNTDWVRNDIDRFVLARLEAAAITPAPEAERRTFIRRASFDLLGLPPSFEQVERFVNDQRPDAAEHLIDELLASPHYGEQWGRHWLDIARYADTRGYALAGRNSKYPYAYTYRDYVIQAFNHDKPYDQFVREQLAADLLDLGGDKQALAAMGFLTVGRRFIDKREEIIDDRIDVVTRGLMGLTVYCSRCHDHKYDPVPTSEYYSLYSIFDNSTEPNDLPIIRQPENSEAYRNYKTEWDKRNAEAEAHLGKMHDKISKEVQKRVGDYIDAWARKAQPKLFEDTPQPEYEKKAELRRGIQERWRRLFEREETHKAPLWLLAKVLIDGKPEAFKADYEALLPQVHPALRARLNQSPPHNYRDLMVIYTRFFRELADIPEGELNADQRAVRTQLQQAGAPTQVARHRILDFLDRGERDGHRKLVTKVKEWEAESPGAPPRAMILNDKPQPHDNFVFVRGNKHTKGPKVHRQFLEVATPGEVKPYTKGSGRLELANSILDPQNPFTWRVVVNRIWQHHMGEGIVRTTSDFGTRGDAPSHPLLLDYLAQKFLAEGKSFKAMHRAIMTSATYRMSSVHPQGVHERDPENHLLSKMNRRRLALEPMRDAMLVASGRLNRQVGGRSVSDIIAPDANRRTLYGYLDRQRVPGFYRVFDFTNPDATTGQRPQTTVPQQALFMMNSPFLRKQAEGVLKGLPETEKIDALFRKVLARNPHPDERDLARAYVESESTEPLLRFAQVLLMSNEFMFVD